MLYTMFPYYPAVQPIVSRCQDLYQQNFPHIKNWDALGKLILADLIHENPELLNDITLLRLIFRTTFVKSLSLLEDNQISFYSYS